MAKKQPSKQPAKGKTDSAKSDKALEALRSEVKRLEASLKKAEGKVERWKGKVATLEKRLAKDVAEKVARKTPAARAEPVLSTTPDTSWTIVRLRAEARKRGVAYSGKTKAQLITALR